MQLPPPIHGVTAINAQIIASSELAGRFDLDVIPLQFSESIADLGRPTPKKLARAGGVFARLAWDLAMRRPAAVYLTLAVQRPALYRDVALLALVRAARVPRIVHLHARPDPEVLPLLRRALHGATVILLSPLLRADFGDAVTDAQIRYVANGLPDLGEIKRVPREVPRVLFLSNLLEAKGPLVLVDALTRLADRGVAFEATFAGAPTNEISESAMRAALAPFEHRVRYVGPVMGEAKQALFRDHDLFVLPTRADAFPLVLLEAMMWGLPVVSTFEGAIPDIVVDGETGCLLPGHDAELLAERLEILIRDQRLRTAMSQRARKRFVEHFTLPHFEHGLADVLSEARPR